ncbi:MAG: polyamine aminopropyltransferase [Eubacteriales bacterium]|nr:polyamine aminopropyltransferase [Eubacteriales bacterium]
MPLYYKEKHSENVYMELMLDQQLYYEQSSFQKIEVFHNQEYGRILTIDDCLMITERDEFIYHEMMVHVPMAVHPGVKRALVIGGGDGGTITRLLMYPEIETIDIVEIDERVVEVCKEFFPKLGNSFNDPRVHLYVEDGLKYIRRYEDLYDLIIVDSTDPFGPGESLFTREFYGNCYKALKPDGILVNQHESPFYDGDAENVWEIRVQTKKIFPHNYVYQVHIPSYPSGHWLFGFMSKLYKPVSDHDAARWEARGIKTRYYNSKIHEGCFALPNYVLDLLAEEKDLFD